VNVLRCAVHKPPHPISLLGVPNSLQEQYTLRIFRSHTSLQNYLSRSWSLPNPQTNSASAGQASAAVPLTGRTDRRLSSSVKSASHAFFLSQSRPREPRPPSALLHSMRRIFTGCEECSHPVHLCPFCSRQDRYPPPRHRPTRTDPGTTAQLRVTCTIGAPQNL
jgi:hypothetical protein